VNVLLCDNVGADVVGWSVTQMCRGETAGLAAQYMANQLDNLIGNIHLLASYRYCPRENLKLALTRTPDPKKEPTRRRGPDPNRPTRRGIF